MNQLDALRAFAVGAVLIEHFFPTTSSIYKFWEWGGAGVRLFFVISGFLITGILLSYRETAEQQDLKRTKALKMFYIRRFIRIFPIYYLTLAITAILGVQYVRETLGWHLSYTSNIFFSITNDWHGPVAHLWSLSVEEQFYLVWPLFILFLPKVWIKSFLLIIISIGFSSRLIFSLMGANLIASNSLTFQCFDFLGVGGLIAYTRLYSNEFNKSTIKIARVAGMVCTLGLLPFYHMLGLFPLNLWLSVMYSIARMVSFAWIVAQTSQGFSGLLGKILGFAPISYIGKISYGIYLYHNFLRFWFNDQLLARNIYMRNSVKAVLLTTLTLVVASLSWYIFEKPINDQKRLFEFPPRRLADSTLLNAEQSKVNLQNA